jgi:predicted sulfurtransferase
MSTEEKLHLSEKAEDIEPEVCHRCGNTVHSSIWIESHEVMHHYCAECEHEWVE